MSKRVAVVFAVVSGFVTAVAHAAEPMTIAREMAQGAVAAGAEAATVGIEEIHLAPVMSPAEVLLQGVVVTGATRKASMEHPQPVLVRLDSGS